MEIEEKQLHRFERIIRMKPNRFIEVIHAIVKGKKRKREISGILG